MRAPAGCPPTLSIVVPAHNEADGIGWAVDALGAGLADAIDLGLVSCGEILVVDDHSTDGTADRVASVADREGIDLGVVTVRGPQGLGSAIRTGLAAAGGDLILYSDADLPFDPIDLLRLLRPIDRYRADLVCGYRFDRTSEGLRRAMQSHVYNALARALLPLNVRDVNFACKLVRREVVDSVLPDLASTGSFIDAELLSRAERRGFHVVQIGIDYFPRRGSVSSLGGGAAIAGILRDFRSLHAELRRDG